MFFATSTNQLAKCGSAPRVLALSLFLAVATANAQHIPKEQSSANALARASFDAIKRQDIPAFVSLFHPEEFKRFKAFGVKLFQDEKPDAAVQKMRKSFAPYNSRESVASANGSDLLTAFLKNFYVALNDRLPGFNENIGTVELQILGEIEEKPDKVHVITRTFMPRPSPVSCQKSDGRWYQLLNEETTRVIMAFEQKEHFRKAALEGPGSMTMGKVDVLGVVGDDQDGEDLVQLLCRITMKTADFEYPVFGCYPVRKGEPAWEHLNDKDKKELVTALRSKWTP